MTDSDTDRPLPTLTNVVKGTGLAGAYSYTVDVTYPGEDTRQVTFTTSIYGGPVVMTTDTGQELVHSAVVNRLGHTITEAWLLAFFGHDPATTTIGSS